MINSGQFYKLFFSFSNPVFYIVFLALVIVAIIYIFNKYVVRFVERRHLIEKRELEIKNTQLMALFAELDPDPVVRVDLSGKVIHTNVAASILNQSGISLLGGEINDFLKLDLNIEDSIKNDESVSYTQKIGDNYYSICFKGISNLQIAQIYFHDITERIKFEDELKDSHKKLKSYSGRVQEIIEEEKQNVSRELHDSIGQNLMLARLKLRKYSHLFSYYDSVSEYFEILDLLDHSCSEVKDISFKLKPRILDELGLGPALSYFCNSISKQTGIKSSVDIVQNDKKLDQKLETQLYRISRDTINSRLKSSHLSEFNIQLINDPQTVKLLFSDNGSESIPEMYNCNESSPGNSSIGFVKETVENMDGKMKIDSSSDNGTVIIVEIPQKAG